MKNFKNIKKSSEVNEFDELYSIDADKYWDDVSKVTIHDTSFPDARMTRYITINFIDYSGYEEKARVDRNMAIQGGIILLLSALIMGVVFEAILQFDINLSIPIISSILSGFFILLVISCGLEKFAPTALIERVWKDHIKLSLEDVTFNEAKDVATTLNEFIKAGDEESYMKVIEKIVTPEVEAERLRQENIKRNMEEEEAKRLDRIKNNKYLSEVIANTSPINKITITQLTDNGVRSELTNEVNSLLTSFEKLRNGSKKLSPSEERDIDRCLIELNSVTLTLNELSSGGGLLTPTMLKDYRKLLNNCEKIFDGIAKGTIKTQLELAENSIKVSNIFLEDKFNLNNSDN